MYEFPLLRRLQRRLGFLTIPNLMMILTGAMGIVYLAEVFFASQYGLSLSAMLYFDRAAIFSGQVWRMITFLFLPAGSNMLWTVLSVSVSVFRSLAGKRMGLLRVHGVLFRGCTGRYSRRISYRIRDEYLPESVAVPGLRASGSQS